AQKLIKSVNQPFHLGQYNHYNSCSLGITLFQGQDVSVDDILQEADAAMYEAKKAGRNNFKFFDSRIKPELDLRANLKNDLFVAVNENQLTLFFQAQVNDQYQTNGAEILLRWQHPSYGMVSPAEFIPIAESSGLIVPIGNWVLQQACMQLKKWEISPATSNLSLSVNVSALQFGQTDFTKQVENAIEQSGCNAKLLMLELTESLVLQNIDDIVNKMQRLKQMGVSLSMDDFGVGYSSLSVLKRLPLDELKIDRSFVLDALASHDNAVIVETIIAMGKSLKLKVIAEGVETAAQLQFLKHLGCVAYQGYMFCKPMDISSFEKTLSNQTIVEGLA
ncbi:MAG TPA: GGDEF domain-containing phosphodiesterase, partial [Methyloradius sp.]